MNLSKSIQVGWVIAAVLTAGCQSSKVERHAFPAEWPAGLTLPRETGKQQASAQPVPAVPVPAVEVKPFALETEGAQQASVSGSGSTSEQLTNLMVQKLKKVGVPVSESQAEYAFSGTVSKLGYTQRSGYPRKLYYTSELVYRLTHRPTGAVVWEGNLSQDFEQAVLVNTMTKLPNDPNAPERVLLEKCISPNWELIASDVKTFLTKEPAAPQQE